MIGSATASHSPTYSLYGPCSFPLSSWSTSFQKLKFGNKFKKFIAKTKFGQIEKAVEKSFFQGSRNSTNAFLCLRAEPYDCLRSATGRFLLTRHITGTTGVLAALGSGVFPTGETTLGASWKKLTLTFAAAASSSCLVIGLSVGIGITPPPNGNYVARSVGESHIYAYLPP